MSLTRLILLVLMAALTFGGSFTCNDNSYTSQTTSK